MKGNDSTDQGNTQNIQEHSDKSCNLKNKKDKLKTQPGCMNCFR